MEFICASTDRNDKRKLFVSEELKGRIAAIHTRSFGTYGAPPRIHAELAFEGTRVGRKRVARFLWEMGLMGVGRRKSVRTTRQTQHQNAAAELVNRDFTLFAQDQLWVADIARTFRRSQASLTFSWFWMPFPDASSVGRWTRACTPSWVQDVLDMALWQRHPKNGIHYSDQGSQYTSLAFGLRCKKAGVRPSMGSVGDCYDNALCESFFATVECELLD